MYVEHLDKQKEKATMHEENVIVLWRSASHGIIKSKNYFWWTACLSVIIWDMNSELLHVRLLFNLLQ